MFKQSILSSVMEGLAKNIIFYVLKLKFVMLDFSLGIWWHQSLFGVIFRCLWNSSLTFWPRKYFCHPECNDAKGWNNASTLQVMALMLVACSEPSHYLNQWWLLVNTLRLRQNGHHFPTAFSNAFSWMKLFELLLRFYRSFFPKGPINNIPPLLRVMAWHRPGD